MSDDDFDKRAQGRLGTVLCGKYRLDSVLGVGGMAVVFAATHRNQMRVAIKMLHSELSVNEQLRTRFLREGYAANTVDHPGAVAVLDDDTAEDGAAFLVMERLEGEEVDRLWEQWGRHLPPDLVLALGSQLLDVLAAAHAKAIIHRDIKPSNLYVTRDGTLKVLDFGIARVRDAASTGPSATSTGMMLGTPAYMAPEQALGKSKQIDGTTDVWSVGATLFTLLSGRYVFEGESVTEVVVLVATQPARSLATVAPHVDPRIVQLVDRALAFHKTERWPSAAAMRDAVRETYQAVFGTRLTKEPLEKLFMEVPLAIASTAHAPSTLPPPTPVSLPPTQGMSPWPDASRIPSPALSSSPGTPPPALFPSPLPGRPSALPPTRPMTAVAARPSSALETTARHVSSQPYAVPPAGVPNKRASTILLVGIGIAALAIGGGAALLLTSGPRTVTADPSSAGALEPRTATPSPATHPAVANPPSTSASATALPSPAAPFPSYSPEALRPQAPQSRGSAAVAPAQTPSAQPPPMRSPPAGPLDFFGHVLAPAPPSSPTPPTGKPAYCATNPTTIDRQGLRVPRPECE
jgi:eukaryotic-like serine/threonine-protein kinase